MCAKAKLAIRGYIRKNDSSFVGKCRHNRTTELTAVEHPVKVSVVHQQVFPSKLRMRLHFKGCYILSYTI